MTAPQALANGPAGGPHERPADGSAGVRTNRPAEVPTPCEDGDTAQQRALLEALRASQRTQWMAEAQQFAQVWRFAELHRSLPLADHARDAHFIPGTEQLVLFGSAGTPRIAEFCVLELAAALGIREEAAVLLIADALDVRYRLPRLWNLMSQCRMRVWQAREIASLTRSLDLEQALQVDRQLAPFAEGMSPGRLRSFAKALVMQQTDTRQLDDQHRQALQRRGVWFGESHDGVTGLDAVVNASDAIFLDAQLTRIAGILAAGGDVDELQPRRAKSLGLLTNPARALQLIQQSLLDEQPELADLECPAAGQRGHSCGSVTVDPERLLPKAQLVIHLSDESLANPGALAKADKIGPVLTGWIKQLTGDCRVSVRPVLDAAHSLPSDSYQVPQRLREVVQLRNPVSAFPFATRSAEQCDLDHTVAYDHHQGRRSEALAQTSADNLAPLSRRAHRAKTHGGWRVQQVAPGVLMWQSPLGYRYLVTPSRSWLISSPGDNVSPGGRGSSRLSDYSAVRSTLLIGRPLANSSTSLSR